MKLSEQAKKELLDFSCFEDFSKVEKTLFAENPGTEEATKQFTDFIQFVHKMTDHPV